MLFSTLRRAIRERKLAEADRDLWKVKAERAEAEYKRLLLKLEDRTDFFVEREFRMMDRFLTAKVNTYAITDEIRNKQANGLNQQIDDAALEAYLAEKKEFLIQCARDADLPEPENEAARVYEKNLSQYIIEFEQGA